MHKGVGLRSGGPVVTRHVELEPTLDGTTNARRCARAHTQYHRHTAKHNNTRVEHAGAMPLALRGALRVPTTDTAPQDHPPGESFWGRVLDSSHNEVRCDVL